MRIENHIEVIKACRFCFMCRHLSPVGNVSFREADTPRVRALILDRVLQDKAHLANPDYIRTLYDAELSAACRQHCVSHYDETGLLLAARADIAAAGLAPANVKALAVELAKAEFTLQGKGDTLYYVDPYNDHPAAFLQLAGQCQVVQGGDLGRALELLGYVEEAEKVFSRFRTVLKTSGARRIVSSCPASCHMMKERLKDVEVVHSARYLLSLGLKGNAGRPVYYLDSDYLRNYDGDSLSPRELLVKLGYELKPFGTNSEESYGIGEGAVVFDRLNPVLASKLCERVYALADDPAAVHVAGSPYARATLRKYNPEFNVVTVEEAAQHAAGK
jgi:Fe-S oxidoreductase